MRPVLNYGSSVWVTPGVVLQEELESMQKRGARFVTGNYNYETGSMTDILGQLKWESLKKRGKDHRLILLYKVLKVKPVYQQMTLSPKLGVLEIITVWHFRPPLPIQMFIKVVSSPRQSGWVYNAVVLRNYIKYIGKCSHYRNNRECSLYRKQYIMP